MKILLKFAAITTLSSITAGLLLPALPAFAAGETVAGTAIAGILCGATAGAASSLGSDLVDAGIDAATDEAIKQGAEALGITLPLVVPVQDAENIAAQKANTKVLSKLQTKDTQAKVCRWTIEDIFKQLLAILKKQILDMMVDQIVVWIQGGGEPKFVTDWSGFLQDAMNETTGYFINELGLTDLCDPLGGGKLKIAIQASLIPIKPFASRYKCTLNKIVRNVERFAEDFNAGGGWITYSESWDPQNNFFGILIMASADLEDRQAKSSGALWSEAIAGAGFLATKKCVDLKSGELGNDYDLLIKRGKYLQDMEAGRAKLEDAPPELCKQYAITTPGKTIGDTVSKALGAEIDWLVNADDLSAYVAAIADALVNRIIKEGANGILGVVGTKAPKSGIFSYSTNSASNLSPSAQNAYANYNQVQEQNNQFTQSYGLESKTGATEFIKQSFLYSLKRLPTINESESYLKVLESGVSKADFLFQLYNSPEYKIQNNLINTTNDQFVTFLYQNLLKRAATDNEKLIWTGPLDRGEATRENTIKGFIDSEEFGTQFNQFLRTGI